jgi:hypothetical protein
MAGPADGWMSATLVFGGVLCYASILPLGARVIYILDYDNDTQSLHRPESYLQLGAWLLSLGFSLLLGAQSVLSWRRWKIQNSHFFIRLEYLGAIILLIVLVDMAQLTLWQTTDPFHCLSERRTPGIITCKVHYLPLWLLSNFLHKVNAKKATNLIYVRCYVLGCFIVHVHCLLLAHAATVNLAFDHAIYIRMCTNQCIVKLRIRLSPGAISLHCE